MKNLMKIIALLLVAAMLLPLAGCSKNKPDGDGDKEPGQNVSDDGKDPVTAPDEEENGKPDGTGSTTKIVTDHNGNEVEVPNDINRIVVCDIYPLPSVIAVFFDSAEKLVGIPKQSMSAAKSGLLGELYPEILDASIGYIDGTAVNIEELMKLEPDVAFYSADDEAMGEALARAGVPALAVSASKWEYDAVQTLDNWIALLSELFPENDRADIVREYSDGIAQLVSERVATVEEKEKVFFLFQYSDSAVTTSGKHFFGEWWANSVGAVNVGGEMDTANSTPVNMEQIYVWNPDRILITNYNTAQPDDIYNNTIGNYDWSGVEAVQSGKVSKMPLGMYRSYTCGVDTPVTLLWMAKTVYPELFEDIDITAEARKYYNDVFGIELSKEQIEKIFAPSSEGSAF